MEKCTITGSYRNTELSLTTTTEDFPYYFNLFMKAFNKVMCVNDETGEILLDWYISEDYFIKESTPFELMDEIWG
jgi:hypothetical protein